MGNNLFPTALTDKWLGRSCGTAFLDELWIIGLRMRAPFRQRALEDGYELPLPTIDVWRQAFDRCFVCGTKRCWPRLAVHHIERRPHCYRPHRDWIENLFLACTNCHDGPLATMPHAKQLAYKVRVDMCGWATTEQVVGRWLLVRDPDLKAPNRVVASEVNAWLAVI